MLLQITIRAENESQFQELLNETNWKKWNCHLVGYLTDPEKRTKTNDGMSLMVRSVLAYMRQNVDHHLKLSDLATHFRISENYLSKLIRDETGVSYRDHMIGIRFEVACSLLMDPSLSTTEVARMVGYQNYVSFYKMFTRAAQQTPSEYRNR